MDGEVVSAPTGRDPTLEYACRAPLALALERALECRIYRGRRLQRPVLDVGCGDGTFASVWLGDVAPIEVGLDPDGAECRRARRSAQYRLVLQATGGGIPLRDCSVATVISNSVLEHIPDLDTVLDELRRVLRPGGLLHITVPTDLFERWSTLTRLLDTLGVGAASQRWRAFYNRFWRHFHCYPPQVWRERLERKGWVVEEVLPYGTPGQCTLHDMLVPAAFPAYLVKRWTGRYFLAPGLRRRLVRTLRGLLPADGDLHACPAKVAGCVFLCARRPPGG
ncbi:MAG: class I SAM-dependent methyltransferase [Planctomycetes bacterium]|nr:class I SAM-dependent methyltransferase [Planctomycetota bacterium]